MGSLWAGAWWSSRRLSIAASEGDRGLQQELAWGQASILGTGLTQAGAWGHGLRCLLLDKHLLEQQNSEKL